MADGSIRIETKLDNSALKQQIKELERELKNIQKEKSKTEAQVSQTRSQFDSEREFDSQMPEEFSHREDIDKRAAAALDPLIAKQEELNQKEQQYLSMLDAAKAKLAEQANVMSASKQVDDAVKSDTAMGKVQSQAEYNSLLDATAAKMAAIEAAAANVAAQTGLSKEQILAANPAYQKLSDTMGMLKAKSHEFGGAAKAAGKKTKAAMMDAAASTRQVGAATKMGIAGFGRMQLGMMGLMFAMRAISAATQEYMAVNSQLEGQMNTLKALWGQILGPAIQWVINLLIQAISVVNAFVNALFGINLVAKANAAALKKQGAAAGGAAKAQKQLASFDEQTKLSDTSGGGGGGGGGGVATLPDGTNIDLSFLDPLMEAIQKFKEDIAPLVETVGNLFKWLWNEVLVPFADWLANGVLAGFLNILGGVALVLNDALLFLQPTAQWLWDNFLEPIASWTGGVIVDVLNAIGDWIHEHHETLGKLVGVVGALAAVIFGIPAILSAIATVLGFLFSPVTLIVAAVAGLVAIFVTCYDECEAFRKGMDKVWEGIKDIFFAGVDFVKALFQGDWAGMEEAWERIEEAAQSLWEGLVEGLKAGWEWAKQKVTDIWENITKKFKEIFGIHSPSTVFADFGKNMMEGLVNGIKNAISKVTTACKEIWSAIKNVFSVVGTWFKDTFTQAWTNVKNVFSTGGKIFDGIKDGIAKTFKTIVNGLISGINRVIAVPFNSINSVLNTIRGISVMGMTPFSGMWGYNPLKVPQIPKLALGGIVNRPGRGVPAIIGEAGAEAVLPLENHTEWMDILADKIGGGTITIPITLDGKKIATYIVDIQKKKAFAMNGA